MKTAKGRLTVQNILASSESDCRVRTGLRQSTEIAGSRKHESTRPSARHHGQPETVRVPHTLPRRSTRDSARRSTHARATLGVDQMAEQDSNRETVADTAAAAALPSPERIL